MQLAFDERGQGPAAVLLHGFPFDRSMWSGPLEVLSAHYRVIAPDLRGHGQSEAPPGPYPMEELAADVVDTLDAAGIEPPYVVGGLSMGGYVALAMADRHADRLAALVLMNTRAGADAPEVRANREATARKVEEAGSSESLAGMVDRLFATGNRLARPELVEQIAGVIRRTPPAGAAGALRGMAIRPDRLDVLRRFDRPVLVIAGEEDEIVPRPESEAMAEAAPKGELVVVPGAGHLTPLEAPAVTDAALLDFLRRVI